MNNVVELHAASVRKEKDARSVVAVGAGLLDLAVPDWWKPGRVDPVKLDQRGTESCVLGQLYGDWITGLAALFENMLHGDAPTGAVFVAAEHAGFWVNEHLPEGDNTAASDGRYAELTEQWRAAIARRRTWR